MQINYGQTSFREILCQRFFHEISATMNILLKGVCFQIANGRNINNFTDLWIPYLRNFISVGTQQEDGRNMYVCMYIY